MRIWIVKIEDKRGEYTEEVGYFLNEEKAIKQKLEWEIKYKEEIEKYNFKSSCFDVEVTE